MSRKVFAAAVMMLALSLLSGCANPFSTTELSAKRVHLPDGGTVVCVSNGNSSSGGLDCDWDDAQ